MPVQFPRRWAAIPPLALSAPVSAHSPVTVYVPIEVDQSLKDYQTAWIAKNTFVLGKLFTDDGMALPSGQMPAQGEESICKAYSQGGGAPLNLRAIAYGTSGDRAYIIGGWGGALDKPEYGKFVLVLRRVDGRWLIVADMDNSNMPRRATPTMQP